MTRGRLAFVVAGLLGMVACDLPLDELGHRTAPIQILTNEPGPAAGRIISVEVVLNAQTGRGDIICRKADGRIWDSNAAGHVEYYLDATFTDLLKFSAHDQRKEITLDGGAFAHGIGGVHFAQCIAFPSDPNA